MPSKEWANLILTVRVVEATGNPRGEYPEVSEPEAQVWGWKETERKPALTCSLIVATGQHQEHFYQVGVKTTQSRHGSLH